jgi:hypothetical protein
LVARSSRSDRRHRKAVAQALAQKQEVGAGAVGTHRRVSQEGTGAVNAAQDFIGHHQGTLRMAQGDQLGAPALGRDMPPARAQDRFEKNGRNRMPAQTVLELLQHPRRWLVSERWQSMNDRNGGRIGPAQGRGGEGLAVHAAVKAHKARSAGVHARHAHGEFGGFHASGVQAGQAQPRWQAGLKRLAGCVAGVGGQAAGEPHRVELLLEGLRDARVGMTQKRRAVGGEQVDQTVTCGVDQQIVASADDPR